MSALGDLVSKLMAALLQIEFTGTDLALLLIGIVVGTATSYYLGKFILSNILGESTKGITVESSIKFESIQQVINYLLGFALGSALLDRNIALVFLFFWMIFQTWLAIKIFKFKNTSHGLIFAFIDTGADLVMGVAFGAGAASFTLVMSVF